MPVRGRGGRRGGACVYIINRLTFFLEKTASIILANNINILYKTIIGAMQQQEIILKRDKNNENRLKACDRVYQIFLLAKFAPTTVNKGFALIETCRKLIEKMLLKDRVII